MKGESEVVVAVGLGCVSAINNGESLKILGFGAVLSKWGMLLRSDRYVWFIGFKCDFWFIDKLIVV